MNRDQLDSGQCVVHSHPFFHVLVLVYYTLQLKTTALEKNRQQQQT